MTDVPRGELPALPVHPGVPPDPDGHRLVVDGLVRRRLELTPDDLAALPPAAVTDDFLCLEGWSVPGLHWEGVAVATLLDAAGLAPEGPHDDAWVQASAGGFSVPLPLADARRGLLALRLGGEPLAPAHGGPMRLVIPGADCFASIKWLDRLEVRREPAANTGREIALGRIGR